MLNLHSITTRLFPSTTPAPTTFGPGSIVTVQTLMHGEQLGVIEAIGLSPFCGEESIYRARVGSLPGAPFFIDYLLVDELAPAEPDFELELESDPDYIQYLHDLDEDEDEAEEEQLDEDEDEYSHPQFMWMGKMFPESID